MKKTEMMEIYTALLENASYAVALSGGKPSHE
jgi:hypothetical protein